MHKRSTTPFFYRALTPETPFHAPRCFVTHNGAPEWCTFVNWRDPSVMNQEAKSLDNWISVLICLINNNNAVRDFIRILFLPSFRSNLRDNAQTRPRDSADFVARPLENERPLTGTRIPTCHPWRWFSMSPKGECRLYSAQRRGKGKCFTWRNNGSRLIPPRRKLLG